MAAPSKRFVWSATQWSRKRNELLFERSKKASLLEEGVIDNGVVLDKEE